MAKQKGPLIYCLIKTRSHVSPNFLQTMALAEGINISNIGYRFKLVEENMINAIAQLKKVIAAAEKANCQEVLDALNEQIEVDHNFPEPTPKPANN